MKLRYLVIIMFILSILTVSAVNASQDSDNLTITDSQEEDTVLEEVQNNEEIASGVSADDIYVNDRSYDETDGIYEVYANNSDWFVQVWADGTPSGNVSVKINDTTYFNKELSECLYANNSESGGRSEYLVNFTDLTPKLNIGMHNLKVVYSDGVSNITKSGKLIVKDPVEITLYDTVMENGDDTLCDICDYNGLNGTITVIVDGKVIYNKTYNPVDDNSIYVDWNNSQFNTYGNYSVKAIYNKTGIGEPYVREWTVKYTYEFYFAFYDDEECGMLMPTVSDDAYWGDKVTLLIKLPKDAKNKTVITFNNKSYNVTLNDGFGKLVLSTKSLNLGSYGASASYCDSKYPFEVQNYTVNVMPRFSYNFYMSTTDQNKVMFYVPKNFKGKVYLYKTKMDENYNAVPYKLISSASVKDGYAEVAFKNLGINDNYLYLKYKYGNYTFETDLFVEIEKNSKKCSASINSNVFVVGEPVTVKYTGVSSSKKAEIYIDGELFKSYKLSKGKLSKSFSKLKTGSHMISIHFEDYSKNVYFTKTFFLKVKPVKAAKLALKKVKVKKHAKKLVLTATLKIDGKAVKGKVLKFKFNKKTYKAKTNKKGVAKVTVKKNVLKKLKVGKKVKYQVSFTKITAKKTAKVKW